MSQSVSWTKARATVLRHLASGLLACVACTGIVLAAEGAKPDASVPDFSANGAGWITGSNDFFPPASGPGPVTFDPAHPYVMDGVPGKQPTFRVADLTNPILMPWVRDELKRLNDRVMAGQTNYTIANTCRPAGVPNILLVRITPVYFLQTPKVVWMIWQNDHMIRRIYMNQPHSANLKPSWFGESVGHYEGDTLVVDTIGLSPKTHVDNYNTPHTDKMHVIERYRMVDGGKNMEVNVTVDDPGAFTMAWSAIQRYRRVANPYLEEEVCAESANTPVDIGIPPVPTANTPDF